MNSSISTVFFFKYLVFLLLILFLSLGCSHLQPLLKGQAVDDVQLTFGIGATKVQINKETETVKRKIMNKRGNKRNFKRGAKVHHKNFPKSLARGGIRL